MPVHDTMGVHHLHRRKRCYLKHEPYPHPDKLKRFVDKSIYFVALAGPVMTIPQIMKIWIEKNASGVSLVSWSSYLILTFFWLYYGVLHKEKPIVFSNAVWIVIYVMIIAGVVVYG